MECSHCQKRFDDRALFDAHRKEHTKTQRQLRRPAGRTYGARYQPDESGNTQQPATATAQPDSNQAESTNYVLRPKEVVLSRDGAPVVAKKKDSRNGDLDEHVEYIIRAFPPYEGDGVEKQSLSSQEIPCKDCKFKFRTLEERDEHYLSRYCEGSKIVAFYMTINSQMPGGYEIQRKTLPLDGRVHKSLFQCKKCPSMFPSEQEKEEHQLTHLVIPSKCLHCGKMFSSKFELEDHYDWHDDMEYRNTRATSRRDSINKNTEPEDAGEQVVDFGHGIRRYPFPWSNTRKWQRKDGEPVAMSYISGEDMERAYAPQGVFQEMSNSYLTIPAGLDQDTVDRVISNAARNSPKLQKAKEAPYPNLQLPDTSVAADARSGSEWRLDSADDSAKRRDKPLDYDNSQSSSLGSGPGFTVFGHGMPGLVQVTDVSGRVRWIRGDALGATMLPIIGSGTRSRFSQYMKAADSEYARGEVAQARSSYIQGLTTISNDSKYEDEELEFVLLLQIALLSSEIGLTEEAISYYMKALDVSQKVYSKDSINNFTVINGLAVLYEERKKIREAAYLYRRSLAGRLKLLGPDHPDSLMTMQELGNIHNKLGSFASARLLLEKAYISYENLSKPDERMTLGTLNNLASTYGRLQMFKESTTLLEPAISRMRQRIELDDQLTSFAVCNYLLFTKSLVIPENIVDIVNEFKEKNCMHGMVALNSMADFFAKHRQFKKAAETYKELFEWRKGSLGTSDPETLRALQGIASCLFYLDKLDEAEEWYDLLARMASVKALPNSPADFRAIAGQSLRLIQVRKKKLQVEATLWGLDKSRNCPCGQKTHRLCSGCCMKNFCSQKCEDDDQQHRRCCYPSVTPAQSLSIMRETQAFEQLQVRFRNLFSVDPMIKKPPKLLSTEAYFIDPTSFATLRILKDPSKIVSFYFNPDVDIRYGLTISAPFQWLESRRAGLTYLYEGGADTYLLVAPGQKMLENILAKRASMGGLEGYGMKFPDSELIEYLQAKTLGDVRMVLGLVLMVWEP